MNDEKMVRMLQRDMVIDMVSRFITKIQTEPLPSPKHSWELEMRVGRMIKGHFIPGYQSNIKEEKDIMTHLIETLQSTLKNQNQKNQNQNQNPMCDHEQQPDKKNEKWTLVDRKRYRKAEYSNHIIRICPEQTIENQNTILYRKTLIERFDIEVTSRILNNIRVSLSQEEVLSYDELSTESKFELDHKNPQYTTIHRISYQHTWLDDKNIFQYDISKVSPTSYKLADTLDTDTTFHAEVELKKVDPNLVPKDVAIEILGRTLALMGVSQCIHYKDGSTKFIPLPKPYLLIRE